MQVWALALLRVPEWALERGVAVGAGVGEGIGVAVGAGVGDWAGVAVGTGVEVGVGVAVGAGVGVGVGVGVCVGAVVCGVGVGGIVAPVCWVVGVGCVGASDVCSGVAGSGVAVTTMVTTWGASLPQAARVIAKAVNAASTSPILSILCLRTRPFSLSACP